MLKAQVSCSDDDNCDKDNDNEGDGDDDADNTCDEIEMNMLQIDAHLDTLIGEQTSFVLSNCGLALLCTSLQQTNQVSPLHFWKNGAIL